MEIIIGYTGFVGSNICLNHRFDKLYNSRNIEEAYGTNPDLCVYSGVRAEKFLASTDPEADFNIILNAIENIEKIQPKKLILISTIDVYKNTFEVDENTVIDTADLQPYGKNRYYLEDWVSHNLKDFHIIRLPGLFGANLKKNFIYDLIHILPSMLNETKFKELSQKNELIKNSYIPCNNGFYKCNCVNEDEKKLLKRAFEAVGFSALNFTDSRAAFQFYNLSYLWPHIAIAVANNIRLLNIAVEPVCVDEIYRTVKGEPFFNELAQNVPNYNVKTIYSELFGGRDGYIFGRQKILEDLYSFINSNTD